MNFSQACCIWKNCLCILGTEIKPNIKYKTSSIVPYGFLLRVTDNGVISVQSALYGRADRQICSEGKSPQQLANTQCSQDGAVGIIKNR